MSPPSEGYPIDKIEAQHQKKQNNALKPQQKDGPRVLKECNFPGQSHEAAKTMKQQRHNVLPGGKPAITARAETILKSNVRR